MFAKIKSLLEGYSLFHLAKKLAGRYISIAASAIAVFAIKWAPESTQTIDPVALKAFIASVLWALFEAARNALLYMARKKKEA